MGFMSKRAALSRQQLRYASNMSSRPTHFSSISSFFLSPFPKGVEASTFRFAGLSFGKRNKKKALRRGSCDPSEATAASSIHWMTTRGMAVRISIDTDRSIGLEAMACEGMATHAPTFAEIDLVNDSVRAERGGGQQHERKRERERAREAVFKWKL